MKKIKEEYRKLCENGVDEPMSRFYERVWNFIESSLLSQKEELRKMVEGMKKKDLWHWMDFADNGFAEGVCEYKDAPKGVDGHTAEFVYNKALEDILENLKQ